MANFIQVFIISVLFAPASCEVYTALTDLKQLLQTKEQVIIGLRNYITMQEQKILLLRQFTEALEMEQNYAMQNTEIYLSNPINAYTLIKRLTTDWNKALEVCQSNPGREILDTIIQTSTFPNEEDLSGAAVGLARLQHTYKLNATSLANGEIDGVRYTPGMSANDCFELGVQFYKLKDSFHALYWLREAERILNNTNDKSVSKVDVLEYMSLSSYIAGHLELALKLINDLLQLMPTHPRATQYKTDYESEMHKFKIFKMFDGELLDTSFVHKHKIPVTVDRENYEKVCRGEITIPEEIKSKLKCYYASNNLDFLKIGPFKVEEAYSDPKMLLFHDVIYDREIQAIKELAEVRLTRAKVGKSIQTPTRISKTAFLKDTESTLLANVGRRVSQMTLLNYKSAEDLQVVNYGIGGQYEAHYDCIKENEEDIFAHLGLGNRVATVLFYMSDVEKGGATAFPYINLAVHPKKGTAVFWYSLFSSGDVVRDSLHAACPVLIGEKWVCNKWIHEYYQEFVRPCEIQRPPKNLIA